jgi:hypothetical protein
MHELHIIEPSAPLNISGAWSAGVPQNEHAPPLRSEPLRDFCVIYFVGYLLLTCAL